MESCYIDVIEVIRNYFNFDLWKADQITGNAVVQTGHLPFLQELVKVN